MVEKVNNPSVTLEQARALDALDRAGTFAAAATALRRGHTSVLYLIRTLEDALGFRVLDRTGYRTRLTPSGRRVLEGCRSLLTAEAELATTIVQLRAGWEATVSVVFDGIVPIDPLLRAVGRLVHEQVPTRIDVRAEFLAGVEEAFEHTAADLMIAVLPPRVAGLVAVELAPLHASLVARADHPLADGRHDERALRGQLLLTVRGSDPRLDLSTSGIEARSTVHLNDFASKQAAILAGIGFGWLPDVLIEPELARGRLRRIQWARPSTHVFYPRLYHRGQPGPAARQLIAALEGDRFDAPAASPGRVSRPSHRSPRPARRR
ncbi:MAG: LysR family transcriptional regulator [Deltaproteobacteria bacterium]|nr:LysR family transcriptional regulator [Deltaproteobacteria bacterium]